MFSKDLPDIHPNNHAKCYKELNVPKNKFAGKRNTLPNPL